MLIITAWKVPKYVVFSGPYFPAYTRDTEYLSVFSPNKGKHGPEKTPFLDTFHKVYENQTISVSSLDSRGMFYHFVFVNLLILFNLMFIFSIALSLILQKTTLLMRRAFWFFLSRVCKNLKNSFSFCILMKEQKPKCSSHRQNCLLRDQTVTNNTIEYLLVKTKFYC